MPDKLKKKFNKVINILKHISAINLKDKLLKIIKINKKMQNF